MTLFVWKRCTSVCTLTFSLYNAGSRAKSSLLKSSKLTAQERGLCEELHWLLDSAEIFPSFLVWFLVYNGWLKRFLLLYNGFYNLYVFSLLVALLIAAFRPSFAQLRSCNEITLQESDTVRHTDKDIFSTTAWAIWAVWLFPGHRPVAPIWSEGRKLQLSAEGKKNKNQLVPRVTFSSDSISSLLCFLQ